MAEKLVGAHLRLARVFFWITLSDDAIDTPTEPKQVDLRRAVSAAYYVLFHLLTTEAALNWTLPTTISRRCGRVQPWPLGPGFGTGNLLRSFCGT